MRRSLAPSCSRPVGFGPDVRCRAYAARTVDRHAIAITSPGPDVAMPNRAHCFGIELGRYAIGRGPA